MSDNPFDDPQWLEFAKHAIDELVPMIKASHLTASIVPRGETDIKFALELGLLIMLDKPLVLLVAPGVIVPEHLSRVADAIFDFDKDHPEAAMRGIKEFAATIKDEEDDAEWDEMER